MAIYDVEIEFAYVTTIRVEAPTEIDAGNLLLGASNVEVAHIQGKSYADISETVRRIINTTEVV